jgi:hypothetical protein
MKEPREVNLRSVEAGARPSGPSFATGFAKSPATSATPSRRAVLVAAPLLVLAACRHETRCATCGMKVDPSSPWVSYVTLHGKEEAFDTPSCAFEAWKKAGGSPGPARFREYYSQEMKPLSELQFVRGSDVVGPMGPDWVPVSTDTSRRFARDHNGAPPLLAEEVLLEKPPATGAIK